MENKNDSPLVFDESWTWSPEVCQRHPGIPASVLGSVKRRKMLKKINQQKISNTAVNAIIQGYTEKCNRLTFICKIEYSF